MPFPLELPPADVLVDAIMGYGLSGVDTTMRTVHVPSVRATATMTLALPNKEDLRIRKAKKDIS